MSKPEIEPIKTNQQDGSSQQKKLLFRLTCFFALVAVLYFVYWMIYSRHIEETDNAYVTGNIIPVTSQINGTVIAVEAIDTHYVTEGTKLVQLDKSDRIIALDEAKANLALILRQTQQLYIRDRGLRASIQARELTLKQASADLKRREQAIHIGGISQEELTHAQDSYNIANSLLTNAKSEWNGNQALIHGTSLLNHPNVIQAISELKKTYLSLLRTSIDAPVSGYVSRRSVQVGQVVAPGSFLMTIVPLEEVWVDANFKEKQLRAIRPGQSALLHADLYGSSVTYHGTVVGFSGGTGSAFSLLPAQNATGNWIKVVQRVPVRIALKPSELKKYPLRIGLSMEVKVNTADDEAKATGEDYHSKTSVFNALDKKADDLIQSIVKENTIHDVDDGLIEQRVNANGH